MPKGGCARHQWKYWSRRGPQLDVGSFQLRSTRKKLARACELSRLLREGRENNPAAVQGLAAKLRIAEPSLRTVEALIRRLSAEVQTQAKREKGAAITRWRRRLLSEPKALGRWLQSKAASAPHSLKSAAGQVSSSALAGAGYIRDYWIDFWSEQERTKPDDDEVFQRLRAGIPAPKHNREVDLTAPSPELLLKVARTMRGAAGPDGWSGPELSHLPLEALSTFRRLAMRWESSGRVPDALHEARMVSLAKEGKAIDGVLDVQHTRPITILNAHWRLWASSWLQTEGFRKCIPDNVRARRGFAIIGTAAGILEDFTEEGYALSLDWSKCFDCLAPAVTARLMNEWNLPSGLASVCADGWSHQVRWVSWSGCTHDQPLRTATSVPQGDPFGPLAAMLWATCGLTEVESRAPAHLPAKTTLYVDDRSITASDPLALVARKRNWFAWSSAVGLRENESKVAVVATTAARRRRAEDSGLAEWIKDSVRVLGAYTASRARQLTEDEAKGLTRGFARLGSWLPLGCPFRPFTEQSPATPCLPLPTVGWRGPPRFSKLGVCFLRFVEGIGFVRLRTDSFEPASWAGTATWRCWPLSIF